MYKTLFLVSSLFLFGCVSTSDYERDTLAAQESSNLKTQAFVNSISITQEAICIVFARQCALTLIFQQSKFKPKDQWAPERIATYCLQEAQSCFDDLSSTLKMFSPQEEVEGSTEEGSAEESEELQ